jgi:S1-C subfamily serine protease
MVANKLRIVWLVTALAALNAPLRAVDIPAPTGIPDRHVVDLESNWVNMTTGGAGRYIVFHLKDARKLALFDVSSGGIIESIDAPGDDLMLAAGIEKLIVLVPSQNILHRYHLATLKREKSFPTPADFKPNKMITGSASRGPLVCHSRGPISLLDIETFQPITIQGDVLSVSTFGDLRYEITVSGDGQTVVGWIPGISGQQFFAMQWNGASGKVIGTPDGYSDAGRYLNPNHDGSLFFRNGGSIFGADLKPLSTEHLNGHVLLRCDDLRYFLAVQPTEGNKNADAWICAAGTLQKIAVVKNVGHVLEGSIGADWGHWRFAPRVRWHPTARTLVSIPSGEKQLLLLRADLKDLLNATGADYLHIVSKPPRGAWVGQPFEYQIEAIASNATINFHAETAPEGFAVSKDGLVKWTPKEKPVGGVERVVVVVSAGGKEVFHTFEISVERPVNDVASATSEPIEPPAPEKEKPESPSPAPASAVSEPVKIDDQRLEVPQGPFLVTPGQAFRSHLLLQGDRLTILGADGVTPAKSVTMKTPYVCIGERGDYYVAAGKDPARVDRIDKQTLEVKDSLQFHAHEITDLVLHPSRPLTYVAFKADVEFPRYRFLVYNETKGEGRESDDYLGTFLAVAPGGEFLIAGYRDIYERGANLIFNPDRIHVVPDYGSVDWLLRYRLDRQGLPQDAEVHNKAGGNGKGIRLSRDGKRVSYLSFVGSPPFSGNLCAWDASDFQRTPTIFAIKDKATTEDLAYHPFLPWVACRGKDGQPMLFDRERGNLLTGKVAPLELGGATVHGLWFAADGGGLILDTSVNEIHYLHRAPLTLSADERRMSDESFKKLASGTPIRAAASVNTPAPKIPLPDLQALQGGAGAPMTSRDVAKWFTDAVVVIETTDGAGTGFLVGAGGYVLTCAHCVAGASEIHVSYRRLIQEETKSQTAEAKLLAVDEERDLALLKFDAPIRLRTVRLGSSADLASGERVCVIGNPGVSTTILDYTITEGIVSSPSRRVGDATLIQTSAQVNPGSSGGPLFNEKGLVIGQVARKANIEGAGFATPSDQIIEFLIQSVNVADGKRLRREWVDSTGTYRIDATLEDIASDQVTLRKTDGAEVAVPLNRLSKPDRVVIDLLRTRFGR